MGVVEVPGKLFLGGEYAVLQPNCTALVLAIDRTLMVHCEEAATDRIEIPRWELDLRDMTAPITEAMLPRERFVRSLFHATRELVGAPPTVHLVAEPHKRDLLRRDLGLGTSSALSVVFAQAFLPREAPDSTAVLDLALRAHHTVQGGRGSGADVATAWAGSSIVFRQLGPNRLPLVEAIPTPTRLPLRILFTGKSQRTAEAVQRFLDLQTTAPRYLQSFLGRSETIVDSIRKGLRGQTNRLVREIDHAYENLTQLATRLHQQDPIPPLFRTAIRMTNSAVKPSGALGGDCLLAVSESNRTLPQLENVAQASGYEILEFNPLFRT